MDSVDGERLLFRIKSLRVESFRVPNARWKQWLTALRNEARIRMCGAGGGRWTRTQIEAVLRQHEGYLASSAELVDYVYPTNSTELTERLKTRHALLIVGPSGTGKTLASKKLFEHLSATEAGLSHVSINPR